MDRTASIPSTSWRWLLLALCTLFATAAQALTQDITSQFSITRSGLALNRATNTYDSNTSLKNTSGNIVIAPIAVAVGGLPAGVTLQGAVGTTADGKPYVTPMTSGSLIQPGGTLSFVLKFNDPQRIVFTSTLQILYIGDVPPIPPTLIRAVPTGGTNTFLVGRIDSAINAQITIQAFSSASCNQGALGSSVIAGGTTTVTTDALGYFGATLGGVNPGDFVAFKATAPSATALSACLANTRDNDSWPKAFPLDGTTLSVRDFIDVPGKARWYKFNVTPGQRIEVTLSGLPADYDLVVFKDIGQAFLAQFNPGSATAADLVKLSAEYAPSMLSPSMLSPSMLSPSMLSPSMLSPDAFSATLFTPSMLSPSMLSPSMLSPSMLSPSMLSPSMLSPNVFPPPGFPTSLFTTDEIAKAFSTAQTRSVIAASITPGTADEKAVVNTWNNTGAFYVRVSARGSAFSTTTPFTLNVTKGATTCTNVTDMAITSRIAVTATGLNTVILTDSSKVDLDAALVGSPGGTLRNKLNAFAARSDVKAIVVDVSKDGRVATLKQQAANNPACPFAKNLVAQEIKGIVDSYRNNPLRYVVIVGNDDAIPFFRSPDLTPLGQETSYVPPVQSNSASEASLRLGFVLSQDGYGSKTSISLGLSDFPVPGLAVGRLVETNEEIAGVLDAFMTDAAPGAALDFQGGVLKPHTSLVTGYDFLADAADAVKNELNTGIGSTPDALITPQGKSPQDPSSWTATQLGAALLGSRHDVIFLAGHFSANSALAADFTTGLFTTDLAASSVNLTNAIVFSAGCHSGYNLVDPDAIPGVTLPLDWAQAFARKRATLIAGTGYQYGDTDFLEYSERLYRNFSRQLRAGTGSVSVGEALVKAKLEYLAITSDIRGIHAKALLESTLFGLPMLGVNMPSGRGGSSVNAGAITPTLVSSGPAHDLGLKTYDLSTAPVVTSHTTTLKNVQGGSDVNATWLSGPDGVVATAGEPVLPLAALNVTPKDAASGGIDSSIVLRGVGFRGGNYADFAPVVPFSDAPSTELRSIHVPFLSPGFYPARLFSINYFGALAGTGMTELLLTPAQHRALSVLDGTSTQRKYNDLSLRLYYSGNLTKAALSDAPTIIGVDAQSANNAVTFTVQVIGDPAAAVYQVWISYTGDGTGKWLPVDLVQCVTPLPALCGTTEDARTWKGQLAGAPANLKYIVQAASGVGLVALDDNRGIYYGVGGALQTTTNLTFVSAPSAANEGDTVSITAGLAAGGLQLANRNVVVVVGGITGMGTTGTDGRATIKLPVTMSPGAYQLTASFAGDQAYGASSVSTPFAVSNAPSLLSAQSSGVALSGTFAGKTEPLQQVAVAFSVTGPNGPITIFSITDEQGRAVLPPPGLTPGQYTVTGASFAGNATYAPTTVTLSQQFTVSKTNQSITFDPLPDLSYGAPAFAVFASASSLLPVSFTSTGPCSIAANVVQVGGAGSCTITASQIGDSNYNPAPSVARTFTISNASQGITFGPVPSGVVGQPLVFVTATSTSSTAAPSTNPITFTSLTPAVCSTGGINGAMLTLVAAGQCTIAANQAGDANYTNAPQVTQSFTVGPAGAPPQTFTVTNLNDSGAGSLRAAIAAANAAAPGPNIINFAPGLTGTIVLTTGQISISRSAMIVGPGADNMTIDASENSRIFGIFLNEPACPALDGPDYLVSISGLRLTNGWRTTSQAGGALYSGHSLTLDGVVIDNSVARIGGGLYFNVQYPGQMLTITNSQFLDNLASPVPFPGGTNNLNGGAVRIAERCSAEPATTPVTVTIANSLFSGNRAQPNGSFSGNGGAIDSFSLADITLIDSRIVDNHVDAASPPVAGFQGTNYRGAAIHATSRSLRIERSEIADNSVIDAAGSDTTRAGGMNLFNDRPQLQGPTNAMAVRIVNSTVSGNAVAATGGAMTIYGNVALELDNSTVSNNSAAPTRTGGIIMSTGATEPASGSNATAPTLKLVSSILANNSSSAGDLATNTATIPAFGVNASNSLIRKFCSTCSIVFAGPGNLVGADPMESALNFNGGSTRTHALLPGSPAINAGSNPAGLTTDQRGSGSPRVVAGAPDIGGYESSQALAMSGGTYFDRNLGLIGTSFLYDPTTVAGTLPSAAVTGPASWNGGASYSCARYQPLAAQPVAAAAPLAYFTTSTGSLVVVDTASNTVKATVGVGANPYAAVVSPTGSRVYVSNFTDGTVSVLDAATNAVIATVPVAAGPQGLAVKPSGSRVYVASFTANTVSVIDTGTNSVIATIPVSGAVDVVVNHAGTRLYVVYTPGVAVIDTTTNAVIGSISRGALSSFGSIAISPDDSLLYAWSTGSASVAVINIGTSSIVATIPIPSVFANDGIAVDPSHNLVYQSNGSSVSKIDAVSNSVVNAVALGTTGTGVNGVAVTPGGQHVYAATANGVRYFDTATATVGSIATGAVRAMGNFVGSGPRNVLTNTPERSICWTFTPPITGSYTGQGIVGTTPFTSTFFVDASNQMAAPQITSLTTVGGSVSVGWTAPAAARSFLVRVNPVPYTGITGEKIVSGASRFTTLAGLALTSGATYQVSVFAFSQDVRTPDPLGSVFNISAHDQTFVAP